MWLVIMVLMLLYTFAYFLTFSIMNRSNFQRSFWNIMSVFIQLGSTENNAAFGQKMIIGSWSIFTIVTISTYATMIH